MNGIWLRTRSALKQTALAKNAANEKKEHFHRTIVFVMLVMS